MALGKAYAECFQGFAECHRPSAKLAFPVVDNIVMNFLVVEIIISVKHFQYWPGGLHMLSNNARCTCESGKISDIFPSYSISLNKYTSCVFRGVKLFKTHLKCKIYIEISQKSIHLQRKNIANMIFYIPMGPLMFDYVYKNKINIWYF